jgi:DNA mismatch repair protein MutS
MLALAVHSILFDTAENRERALAATVPSCFADLNLDQIVDAITADFAEYDLKPFFYCRLNRVEAVCYRHQVMQDLQNADLLNCIKTFANAMRDVRAHLAQAGKLHYQHQKEAWHLDAVGIYCNAVRDLSHGLEELAPKSRGLLGLREYWPA